VTTPSSSWHPTIITAITLGSMDNPLFFPVYHVTLYRFQPTTQAPHPSVVCGGGGGGMPNLTTPWGVGGVFCALHPHKHNTPHIGIVRGGGRVEKVLLPPWGVLAR
jgi:hypothetical protein